ncbi:MAG: Vitamin B12 dependent methionine synthase activation subunit [Clostridia bacterium]|nr:Vitamin B12 dependent methionine synthase activation subunit [Clostridia bacterium]
MCKTEIKTYSGAPVDYGEVMRYAGAKKTDADLKTLIDDCLTECEKENAVNFAVCFTETPVTVKNDETDLSVFTLKSKNLATALFGAESALIFACTIGIGIDRLIKKYTEIDPVRALVLQALGAERVETFIEVFIKDYEKTRGVKLSPRFSAGYGDLPLDAQKDIFGLLNPQKNLGLTLNDSLMMSPSKSVTAFAAINGDRVNDKCGCENCGKNDCGYRR